MGSLILTSALVALLPAVSAPAPAPLASVEEASPPTPPVVPESPSPPQPRPPEILAPLLPSIPAAGKGRLALWIGGDRRWCTYPDDRLVRPPEHPGGFQKKNEVFTFGYKFSVAAVKRGQADTPLMLFESPVFQTASWLPASKVGQARKSGPAGPIIVAEGEPAPKLKQPPKGPDTLVPYWHEMYRCVTLPARMDFDLDPGTYDVYVAFDLLNRDGGWVHRTTGYLTDIPVESARSTRLDGLINMAAGGQRQVELQTAAVESAATPTSGATDP